MHLLKIFKKIGVENLISPKVTFIFIFGDDTVLTNFNQYINKLIPCIKLEL